MLFTCSSLARSFQVLRNPNNALTLGPNSANFASQHVALHPINAAQNKQQNAAPNDFSSFDHVRRTYGSGLAMTLATEVALAKECGGRLPGFDANPDSNIILDTLSGSNTMIGFGDILNLKENRVEAPKVTLHKAMEVKLGLM